jgi:predicted transposase/invertase (TIGR01784 family)
MFKRMFCSEANKDVLIWFLNMVLEDVDIKSVDFIPTEHLGLTKEDRKVIFDISCECSDGKKFIIEMQKGYQRYFRERALYYTTYPINAQGKEARELYEARKIEGRTQEKFKWDYNLKPVIVVALLNFEFKHSDEWPEDKYLSSYRLLEDTEHEPMTNTLRFVFLELGRFRKRISELETKFEKWVYLLKNMHNMKDIPPEFDEPLFQRLFLLAEIGNFTADEVQQYYNSLSYMGDYDNILNTAKEDAERIGLEKGLARGLAEGRAEGRAEAQHEMARKMLAAGMPVEQIAELTGLAVETLCKLQ